MMNSKNYIFRYDSGEIQRVQKVSLDSFQQLAFVKPQPDREALRKLYELYRDYLMVRFAMVYGYVILFSLPEGFKAEKRKDEKHGIIYEDIARVTADFRENITVKKGELCFLNEKTAAVYEYLKNEGCLYTAKGKLDTVSILPVGNCLGYLSGCQESRLLGNSSFFVMDRLDCATVYDVAGTPIGLNVLDGKVLSPCLFDREVLLVDRQGHVSVEKRGLEDLIIEIDGVQYKQGRNCRLYTRDRCRYSEYGGDDIVIIGDRVVGFKRGGHTPVPSSGLIMKVYYSKGVENRQVIYHGFEDCQFALQVGNSVLINGRKTLKFRSHFSNYLDPLETDIPPAIYPMNFNKARAPRIILGADKDDKPMILWFEGAGKFGHVPGRESCGASLREAAYLSEKLGLHNGIHLDGGGSAQIEYEGKRYLKISDRDFATGEESERPIPMGIVVR